MANIPAAACDFHPVAPCISVDKGYAKVITGLRWQRWDK